MENGNFEFDVVFFFCQTVVIFAKKIAYQVEIFYLYFFSKILYQFDVLVIIFLRLTFFLSLPVKKFYNVSLQSIFGQVFSSQSAKLFHQSKKHLLAE